jgi:hypothetical protein
MQHSLRRLAIGAALAGVTFAAAPAIASASSSCSYDGKSRSVYIQDGSGSSTLHVGHNPTNLVPGGGLLMYADGNGVPGPCAGSGTLAGLSNTDEIYIQGPATSKDDTLDFDETNGSFGRIRLDSMSTSSVLYALSVHGTPGADTFRVTAKGDIDLDADGNPNVSETYGASSVALYGGGGNDTLDGRGWGQHGPNTVPLWLFGGDNDDVLLAGRSRTELYGNGGNDDMTSSLNGYVDVFEGGDDYDTAFTDKFDIGNAERRVNAG